ncbi:MAG: winged-helix domain-containing protein, partial [Phycisphaerales bacterium]
MPRPTVQRLSLYLRELERLAAEGRTTVSSRHLGTSSGATDAQVRKDLGFIGHAGQPGVGYALDDLIGAIREAIGVHRAWRATGRRWRRSQSPLPGTARRQRGPGPRSPPPRWPPARPGARRSPRGWHRSGHRARTRRPAARHGR